MVEVASRNVARRVVMSAFDALTTNGRFVGRRKGAKPYHRAPIVGPTLIFGPIAERHTALRVTQNARGRLRRFKSLGSNANVGKRVGSVQTAASRFLMTASERHNGVSPVARGSKGTGNSRASGAFPMMNTMPSWRHKGISAECAARASQASVDGLSITTTLVVLGIVRAANAFVGCSASAATCFSGTRSTSPRPLTGQRRICAGPKLAGRLA